MTGLTNCCKLLLSQQLRTQKKSNTLLLKNVLSGKMRDVSARTVEDAANDGRTLNYVSHLQLKLQVVAFATTSHAKKKSNALLLKKFLSGKVRDVSARAAEDAAKDRRTLNYVSHLQPKLQVVTFATTSHAKKRATQVRVALFLVRDVRLELTRSPTRPLNVRVCRFRQSRIACTL